MLNKRDGGDDGWQSTQKNGVPTIRTFLVHACDDGVALKKSIFHE